METQGLYQRLHEAKHEVRLMRTTCAGKDILRCELQTFSLDDKPDYKALSYCWTQAAPTCKIFVNGVPFFVRPNLFDYLELRDKDGDTKWIFIDAICINQRDVAERSSQVRLIGDVYRGATQVIVWLGNEDRWRGCDPNAVNVVRRHCEGSAKLDFRELHDATHRPSIFKAFRKAFLPPEYWLRAWIVQEISLSRTLVFRYRSLELDVDSFESFLYRYKGHGHWYVGMNRDITDDRAQKMLDGEAGGNFFALDPQLNENLEALAIARGIMGSKKQRTHADKSSLSSVITAYGTQRCSVWHDIVYAFLGLTNSGLRVDYSLSRIELYASVMVEGTAHIFRPPVRRLDNVRDTTFNHFLLATCRALQVDVRAPTVSLLTQRALEICGIEKTTFYLREAIESFDIIQCQGNNGLTRHERDCRTYRMLRKTQRRIQRYRLTPWICMPVLGSERPRTHSGWVKWMDSLHQEITSVSGCA